jgi:hypothetical protein
VVGCSGDYFGPRGLGDGVRKPYTVHRLVALAFHGEMRNALHREVAHLDGSKTNARADNLKWVSRTENESHKYRHGTRASHRFSRLTEEQARAIKLACGVRRYADIAREYGVSESTISGIAQGKRWRRQVSALNPDAFAFIILQREYRSQMDQHAMLRHQAQQIREDLERTEAKALTASERATSILETMLKLEQPKDAAPVGGASA